VITAPPQTYAQQASVMPQLLAQIQLVIEAIKK
jgi:hypothetical protein